MTDRILPTSATPTEVSGDAYMDAVFEKVGRLFDASRLRLSSVAGTADAITASLDPTLTSGLVDGMSFYLRPVADNTGAATLAINGGAAIAIVDSLGTGLGSGALMTGLDYELLYDGTAGELRLLGSAQVSNTLNYQAFTASGTWTKPTATPDDAQILVECWGGGGGGGGANTQSGAGGGGGYNARLLRASAVASTVTVTVGAGGAITAAGGNSSFGAHVTAYGGGGAVNATGGGGGGGGGQLAAGGTSFGAGGGAGGGPVGGSPSTDGVGGGGGGSSAAGGDGYFGGGGGGTFEGGAGGDSCYGGGGGAASAGTPGASVFGGAGGAAAVAGTAPAGGGGRNAAGARGEVRVWVIG